MKAVDLILTPMVPGRRFDVNLLGAWILRAIIVVRPASLLNRSGDRAADASEE